MVRLNPKSLAEDAMKEHPPLPCTVETCICSLVNIEHRHYGPFVAFRPDGKRPAAAESLIDLSPQPINEPASRWWMAVLKANRFWIRSGGKDD